VSPDVAGDEPVMTMTDAGVIFVKMAMLRD